MISIAETTYHIPVLSDQVCSLLITDPSGIYVDCTFGGGGHSIKILSRLGPEAQLIAIDKDKDSPGQTIEDKRLRFIRGDFRFLKNYLEYLDIDSVDGILADLGVSAHQLAEGRRGFSFKKEAPLDMRMSQDQEFSAFHFLKKVNEKELSEILRNYGELSQSTLLAKKIIYFRDLYGLNNTSDLVKAISGFKLRGNQEKLLACVFQAIRIHINDELGALKKLLSLAPQVLKVGGRIVILSYHSLEDRLVKNFFKCGNFEGEVNYNVYGQSTHVLNSLASHALKPEDKEITENPKARSARLRAAEKLKLEK